MMKNYKKLLKRIFLDRPDLYDVGLMTLYYEQLPCTCTLEEIKLISKITDYSYRIGKLSDGTLIAIVCIPNPNSNINGICFENDLIIGLNNIRVYDFQNITEEEVGNYEFIVYPYCYSYRENYELQNAVSIIIEKKYNDFGYKKVKKI